eukprot:539746-Pelagomonas_calceolata.AAC.2
MHERTSNRQFPFPSLMLVLKMQLDPWMDPPRWPPRNFMQSMWLGGGHLENNLGFGESTSSHETQ